jgi:UDP-2,3-diacylglucosamine hydrolase
MGAAVPSPHRWTAPAAWQAIDFIADLHLSADTPRTFEALAGHLLHTAADAVLLLGDVFEFWVGDDQRERPFERRCLALLAQAAQRRPLAFMAGNRDFLAGPALAAQCGWTVLPDPTLLQACGQRVLLSHGDALCLADTEYQCFRAQSRAKDWQHAFLALPLAQRLQQASAARAASQARKLASGHDPDLWADVDPQAALQWLDAAGADWLVHGHTHRPGVVALAPGRARHVLTDWDLDSVPDTPRGGVLRLTAGGLQHLPPAG